MTSERNDAPIEELAQRQPAPRSALGRWCQSPRVRPFADQAAVTLATGFYVGMVPPRTATLGTLLGIPLALGVYTLVGWYGYLPVIAALWMLGTPICERAATLLNRSDPREIVYDEIVTLPIVFFLTPILSWKVIAAGFVLHRIFDIGKPFGVRRLEQLGGGLGIMADDLLAAIYGWGVLQLLIRWNLVG